MVLTTQNRGHKLDDQQEVIPAHTTIPNVALIPLGLSARFLYFSGIFKQQLLLL